MLGLRFLKFDEAMKKAILLGYNFIKVKVTKLGKTGGGSMLSHLRPTKDTGIYTRSTNHLPLYPNGVEDSYERGANSIIKVRIWRLLKQL